MYKVILKNTHSVYQNNVLSAKKPKSSFSVKWNELVSKIWKEIKPTTKSGGLLKNNEETVEYKYISNLNEMQQRLYRVIHKSLRDFRTRLRNNQNRHGRKEHINR